MPKRAHIAVPVVVLGLAAAGLVGHALMYPFICDDAYITFRYSWNFAHHGELAFNLGERVEGYTNFLWMVVLAGFLKLGLRPDVMARVLGVVFGAATIALLYLLTRSYRGGRRTGWDFLAGLMLPATGGYAVWCSGGLETQFFTALMIGGVTLYVAEESGRVERRMSGFVFALSAMTRPEGMLVFGLTGLHRAFANLIGQRRVIPTKREVFWALGFFVPFGLFFAFRYTYYGHPFPNTYYVKTGGGTDAITKWGLPYLWDFIKDNHLYAIAPLLLTLPFARFRPALAPEGDAPRGVRPRFVFTYVAMIVLTYVAYIVRVGGDFMAMGRFFVPVLPLIYFFFQESLRETVERFPRRAPDAWRPSRLVPIAAIILAAMTYNATRIYADNQKLTYYRWGLDTIAYLEKFADDRIKIGTWMRQNFPKDTYVAVGGAGAIVYASRLRALDAFGLSEEWIAHHAPRSGDRPGHSKFAPEQYVLDQKPDLICHIGKHQDWPYRPDAGEEELWRGRGYRWVCLNPPDVRPAFYCCLERIESAEARSSETG